MNNRKQVLEQQIAKVKALYQDYSNNPFSVELVHDLRVAIRELRGLIHFIKKRMTEADYAQINKVLAEAGRVFGTLRELDVLHAYCEGYALKNPNDSDAYYQLFNAFVKDRRIEMNRTFNKTNQEKMTRAIEESQKILDLDLFDNKKDWKKYTLKRMKKQDEKLNIAYHSVNLKEYQAVHDIRKKAKKLRYAAAYFDETVSKDLSKYEKNAKAIQAEFGNITDNHVNYDLLTAYAEKTADSEVSELLLKIRESIIF